MHMQPTTLKAENTWQHQEGVEPSSTALPDSRYKAAPHPILYLRTPTFSSSATCSARVASAAASSPPPAAAAAAAPEPATAAAPAPPASSAACSAASSFCLLAAKSAIKASTDSRGSAATASCSSRAAVLAARSSSRSARRASTPAAVVGWEGASSTCSCGEIEGKRLDGAIWSSGRQRRRQWREPRQAIDTRRPATQQRTSITAGGPAM